MGAGVATSGLYTRRVIQKLSLDQIVQIVGATPEQAVFDWKRTFRPPRDEEGRASQQTGPVWTLDRGPETVR
jgi:hypothetical protein